MFVLDIDLMKVGEYLDIETETWEPCAPREVWLGEESTIKADLRGQLFCLAAGLADRIDRVLQVPALVAYSGSKGVHVYGLLDRATAAAEAREAGAYVLESWGGFVPSRGKNFYKHDGDYRALEIEVYPKQDAIRDGDGLGNLVRLPLGVNRKTKQHGFFIDLHPTGPLNGPFQHDDPITALTHGSVRTKASAK
jgi:hypothetical protein